MNGVEILATEEVVAATVFSWKVYWIAFGVIMGMLVIVGLVQALIENDASILLIFVCVGAFFASLFSLIPAFKIGEPSEYETQYKVTITDEVSMNDFLEKYEIVDQEGKIYTVRERGGVEDGK